MQIPEELFHTLYTSTKKDICSGSAYFKMLFFVSLSGEKNLDFYCCFITLSKNN